MTRRIWTLVGAVCVAGLIAGGVVASGGNVGQRGHMFYLANPFCDGSGYADPGTLDTNTKYKLKFKAHSNSLSGSVTIKDGAPNTTYDVRIIQGVADCFTADASFTTNFKGKGSAKVGPETAVSTTAFLFVSDASATNFWASGPIILVHGSKPLHTSSVTATDH
jgi:hypothetical protein